MGIKVVKQPNGRFKCTAQYEKKHRGKVIDRTSETKTFDSESVGRQWARKTMDTMKAGTWTHPDDRYNHYHTELIRDATIKEVIDRFLKDPDVKKMQSYDSDIKPRAMAWVEEFKPTTRISEIMPADIKEAAAAWEQTDGAAANTIKNRISRLSTAIRHHNTYLLSKRLEPIGNPAAPRDKEGNRLKLYTGTSERRSRTATDEEVRRAIKACSKMRDDYMPDIIRFALATAWRAGEIRRLQWKNVNLDPENPVALLPPRPYSKVRRYRPTPLAGEAEQLLSGLRDAFEGDEPPPGDWYVFGKGPEPRSQRQITKAWIRVCNWADIDDLHFHDLRHTAITRLVEEGYDINEVMWLFSGHLTRSEVEKYTHLEHARTINARRQAQAKKLMKQQKKKRKKADKNQVDHGAAA